MYVPKGAFAVNELMVSNIEKIVLTGIATIGVVRIVS